MKSNDLSRYRLSESNPFAPPDRRYHLARKCLKSGGRPSFRDDGPTWELFRFLLKRESVTEPSLQVQVRRAYPGLSISLDLHHGRARKLRPMIEAYVLAGANDDLIAARLNVPAESVYWFRLAFYDVEHLRHASLRVVYDLIGTVDEDGQSELDEHRLWKLVGFTLKVEALDQLLYADDKSNALPEGGLAAWIKARAQSDLQMKQWIVAHRLNVNDPKHIETLLKLSVQAQCSQRQSDAVSPNRYEQHIKAFLEEIPWTQGEAGKEAFKNTKIGEWDDSATELRADEQLRLATGQDVPELEEWRECKLPPPPKRKPTNVFHEGGEILE